ADLELSVEGLGNPPEHAEGVALVVGVFQTGDGGLLRVDQIGELLLGEPGRRARLIDRPCDLDVHGLLGDHLAELGVVAGEPLQDLGCVTRLLGHRWSSTRIPATITECRLNSITAQRSFSPVQRSIALVQWRIAPVQRGFGLGKTAFPRCNGVFPRCNGPLDRCNGPLHWFNGAFPRCNGAFPRCNEVLDWGKPAFSRCNGAFHLWNGPLDRCNGVLHWCNGAFPRCCVPMPAGRQALRSVMPGTMGSAERSQSSV